jgi:hypothetical protein
VGDKTVFSFTTQPSPPTLVALCGVLPQQVIKAKESGSQPPVVNIDGSSFFYTRHKDIFLVAVTRLNANACA